jgi:hypothetical protein
MNNSAGRARPHRPNKKFLKNKPFSITAYSSLKNQNKKMKNSSPHSLVLLRPLAVTLGICLKELSACLQPHIGDGKTYTVAGAALVLGCDERTLRNYVTGINLPPLPVLLRMFALFPFMANRLLRLAGLGNAMALAPGNVADLTLNRVVADLVAKLGRDLEDGHLDPKERADLADAMPDVITALNDWTARALAARAAASHVGQQLGATGLCLHAERKAA